MKEHEIYNLVRACKMLQDLLIENCDNKELSEKLSGALTYLSEINFTINFEKLENLLR